MKIPLRQLERHLTGGLAGVYLLASDAPLLVDEAVEQIRAAARGRGFDSREVHATDRSFRWAELESGTDNLSLFASRKIVEVRMPTPRPGDAGARSLISLSEREDPNTLLIVAVGQKLDSAASRSAWVKSIDAHGVVVEIWPIERQELPRWIVQRARQYGKSMQREAAALIAQKVEGNLLAARQELEKLCLLVSTPEISMEQVMSAVNDSARYDIFALIETACQGNGEHAARMLRGLQSEGIEPINIFGALMWELRRICAMANAIEAGVPKEKVFSEYRVWQQRKAALSKLLQRLPARQLTGMLSTAYTIDRSIKGALRRDPWELLEKLMLQLAGTGNLPAT